jgi:hypothetical protein
MRVLRSLFVMMAITLFAVVRVGFAAGAHEMNPAPIGSPLADASANESMPGSKMVALTAHDAAHGWHSGACTASMHCASLERIASFTQQSLLHEARLLASASTGSPTPPPRFLLQA